MHRRMHEKKPMSLIRSFAQARPVVFVVVLFVVHTAMAFPFVILFKLAGWGVVPLRLIIPIVDSAFMIWLIWYLGWFQKAGFTGSVRNMRIYWFPLVLAFMPVLLRGTVEIPAISVAYYTAAVVFTGISEEAFARGIVLNALRAKGKWFALVFAAGLFSIGHFTNLFFEDFGFYEMSEKLLSTFSFAVLYGAIFMRTGNIWPLIVLHTIHDYSFLTSGTAGPFTTEPISMDIRIALAALSLAYGILVAQKAEWAADDSIRTQAT